VNLSRMLYGKPWMNETMKISEKTLDRLGILLTIILAIPLLLFLIYRLFG